MKLHFYQKNWDSIRKSAIPLVLVGASVLLFFIGLEGALRLIAYPRTEAKVLCLDAIVGNVYCPNLDERLDNLYGSTVQVTTNSLGMADREYGPKPAGTLRIALVGDSLTASLYLPQAQKFKTLWEEALAKRLGRPVEIMNLAVDGQGTWEEIQMFHLRARPLQPDAVIAGFFWGNDVWNNLASRDRGRANPLKDEYAEPGWLMRTRVAHRKSIRWLFNNSAAFQFLDTLKDRIQTQQNYQRAQAAGKAAGKAAVADKAAEKAAGPAAAAASVDTTDPARAWDAPAWQLTRELLLKFKAEGEAAGAPLLVLQLPMLAQLDRAHPLPHKQFSEFLAANGIGDAQAFAALDALSREEQKALYIGDEVHLTAAGHKLIAEATLGQVEAFLRERVKGK